MARYRHTFSVTGRLPFPDDMLRYDSCQPSTPGSAQEIADSQDYEKRAVRRNSDTPDYVVTLVRESERRYWEPTYGRWQSFGWAVVLASMMTEKLPPARRVKVRGDPSEPGHPDNPRSDYSRDRETF